MKKKKILITGASSDIGLELINKLNNKNFIIGAHCFKGKKRLISLINNKFDKKNIKIFSKNLNTRNQCIQLVKRFHKWSKGLDIFIQLHGNVSKATNWKNLDQKNFTKDIHINLSSSFFLSQEVFKIMQKTGGKLLFTSTSSALHGGGANSMAYGLAKSGLISLSKGIAREGGKYNILSNCIAPGFINTRFHTKVMKRTQKQIKKRARLNSLNKAGSPTEIADLIFYIVSDKSNFITGQVINVDGGDWI